MFWGLILKSNKRYTQTLEKSFHLAQASLETSTANDGDVQVWFANDEQTFLLCTLRKSTVIQKSLNLNFTVGDKVTFFSKGNGIVHLTGSLLPEGFDDDFDSDEDDDVALDDDEKTTEKPNVKEERKEKAGGKPVKIQDPDDEDDDMDEDALGADLASEEDSSDNDDDDDDDEDDDDSDDSEEEEEVQEQPKKKQKLDGKKPVQNGLENGKNPKDTQKAKKASDSQQNKQAKGNKLVLQGGVVAIDRQAGNGKEAKAGKKVQVYYEGRLKDTNKIFDSSKQGPGFKFTLGRGEVIKGWDVGVSGMKVGGKRTLTIPANLAYGAKGYPPTIPPNSTLIFDVELKNVF